MSKIDYVFLDGGHEYNTVMNDLNCCFDVIKIMEQFYVMTMTCNKHPV